MRRFVRYLAPIFLAIAVSAGCVTQQPRYITSAAYSSYAQVKDEVSATTVSAMLSYAASTYSRARPRSWEEAQNVFVRMAKDMQSNGRVSPNYTVTPQKAEISLFIRIAIDWVKVARSRGISLRDSAASFRATAAECIVRIQNDEYVTPSI